MEGILYRLENAFITVVAFYVFLIYGTEWTGFLLFLAFPAVLNWLPSSWQRNRMYERLHRVLVTLVHSYSIVLVVSVLIFLFTNVVLWSILGWVIHIAIDRVVKYREKTIQHPLFEIKG